jgi:hypothetical protein
MCLFISVYYKNDVTSTTEGNVILNKVTVKMYLHNNM